MIFSLYKKILGVIAIIAFIFVAVFGFLAIVPSHHHEPGCPFMIGEQSICPMGLFEHIQAWQSMFTVSLPSILLLIAFLFIVVTLWQSLHPPNLLFFVRKKAKQTGSHNLLYQELFSRGILNPKAP